MRQEIQALSVLRKKLSSVVDFRIRKRDAHPTLGVRKLVTLFQKHISTTPFKIAALDESCFEKSAVRGTYKATPVRLAVNASVVLGLNLKEYTIRKHLNDRSIEEKLGGDELVQRLGSFFGGKGSVPADSP